ncbi:MAG: MMPL family transporter [Hyphomicrobiales bacterium]|nr:MMPL family transporter [Hyphomicrobiales bacterium]
MAIAASTAFRAVMAAWVARVAGTGRAAALVAAACLALTAAAGWYFAAHLAISTDTSDMLSPELDFRRNSRALSQAFPQFSDNILVVIDGATADLADDTALSVAKRLRADPALFGEVYDLAGDPFFRRNGLLYLDRGELADLADRLAEAQPFLGALWRDPSLRGLGRMLGLALDQAGAGGDLPLDLGRVLDRMAEVAEAQARGRFATLSWQELMGGGAAGQGGAHRRYLLIQPRLDYGSLQPVSAAMDGLRALAAEMGLDRGVDSAAGARLRLTGSAALAQEELKSVETGMGLAGLLSAVLVMVLLMVGLRAARLVVAVLVTLAAGLVWTAAFAIAALGELNLISVAFAVLFIGLSVDFGIHFGLRYMEARRGGADHAAALEGAGGGVGGALTLSAVAAAIGFYAFLPTAYVGLAQLGLIAGTGMFIALFANLTLLPALLTLMPPRVAAAAAAVPAAPRGRRVPARPVLWAALVLGLGALALVPSARFDFDPLNLKDPHTESVATLFDLMDDPDTNPYSVTVLAPDLDAAQALKMRLAALPPVAEARTLADYVPRDQDDKLDIIGDMALFLTPALAATPEAPPTAAENAAAVADLRARLDRVAQAGGGLAPAAARLARALPTDPTTNPGAVAELQRRLLSGLPGRLAALRDSLDAAPVTLADLPAALRDRQVAADGRAKVEVHPRHDLRDRAALETFVAAVRTVAPDATGAPVIILEAGDAVVTAFAQAGGLAVVVIGLLLAVLLRRARDVALVFAPLVLAAVLTVAASVLIGQPFNFANVIVLPLLFGLGVAGGIHLVLRERQSGSVVVMATSTPRAVVFSALTTIGSFGSIALSSHPGTASMGVLLTIAITLTLACTLGVLPAMMAAWPARRDGAGNGSGS